MNYTACVSEIYGNRSGFNRVILIIIKDTCRRAFLLLVMLQHRRRLQNFDCFVFLNVKVPCSKFFGFKSTKSSQLFCATSLEFLVYLRNYATNVCGRINVYTGCLSHSRTIYCILNTFRSST